MVFLWKKKLHGKSIDIFCSKVVKNKTDARSRSKWKFDVYMCILGVVK